MHFNVFSSGEGEDDTLQYGLYANLTFFAKENSIPAKWKKLAPIFPGAKACKASELIDPDMRDSLFANTKGIFGISGSNKATGTFSFGANLGYGYGYQQCWSNPMN